MKRVLKFLFFLVLVYPLIRVIVGLCVCHKERLPRSGPAILVANHNSHLDTLVLMSLLPWSMLPQIRPLADAQYFLQQNRWLAWFSRHILNIIAVPRQGDCAAYRHFLTQCTEALRQNNILILYPEGTRGEPECLTTFKSGITHLVKQQAQVPVIPVFLRGLGKTLPKGECVLVPFFCHVWVGEALFWTGSKQTFLTQLQERFQALSTQAVIAI